MGLLSGALRRIQSKARVCLFAGKTHVVCTSCFKGGSLIPGADSNPVATPNHLRLLTLDHEDL